MMAFSAGETLEIPSPIDVHAHLREPGGEAKETIESGTFAAMAGGYQAVFDMPNNPNGHQTWSADRLRVKHHIGEMTANTNIGFYAGVDLDNPAIDEFEAMVPLAAGLKLYLGHTTGNTKQYGLDEAKPAIDSWMVAGLRHGVITETKPAPILLHAEGEVGHEVANYIASMNYPVHWCHVSTAAEATMSGALRRKHGDLFTSGVTPHHLTMTERDADLKYGWMAGRMMPKLGKEADGDALLYAFNHGDIQIIETDHAPHTSDEKLRAERENPLGDSEVGCVTCFGISGIEFVLPVMTTLVQHNKMTMGRLIAGLHHAPAAMLGLKQSGKGAVTRLTFGPYEISEDMRAGKSRNNPYVGWLGWAHVEKVMINGIDRRRHSAYPEPFIPRVLRSGSTI